MKLPLCFIIVLICHLVCYAIKPSSAFYEALSKGARTRMVCHIADERGSPVANANVRVVLAKNDTEYSLNSCLQGSNKRRYSFGSQHLSFPRH